MRAGLKVLLVAEFYSSGGTRTYLRQLLEFYSTREAHVTLVGLDASIDPGLAQDAERYGFRVIPYSVVLGAEPSPAGESSPPVWSWRGVSRERSAFRRLGRSLEADCVIVSAGTPGMFLGAAGSLANSLYVLHTYPHGRRQDLLGRTYMSRLLPRRGTIVAVSDFERETIVRLWRPSRRGVEVVALKNTCGPLADGPARLGSPIRVLTASWLEPYKQPFHWIDVAEAVLSGLPPGSATFTWLGDGSQLDAARARASASRFSPSIQFPGHLDDVEPWYREASLYLQLSSVENMSLSTLDAQRHGLPSVVTDVGGLPEIVRNGVTGLVVRVDDVAQAASAITDIVSDEDRWTRFSVAAQENYRVAHSPDVWERSFAHLHASY